MIRYYGRGVGKFLTKQQQQQQQLKQRAHRLHRKEFSLRRGLSCRTISCNSHRYNVGSAHEEGVANNNNNTHKRSMTSFVGQQQNQKIEESLWARAVAGKRFTASSSEAGMENKTAAEEEATNNNNNMAATPGKPYKVLIANRGEIAKRVIETCQKHGFPTVAIYSTADSKAPHVRLADEAICVGPASSSESYLDVEKVLKAIDVTGADAVHPGYGFLSENADFAKSVIDAGKIWLGPPISSVQDMGCKIQSKIIAKEAGVNTIPGYKGVIDSIEHAIRIVNEGITSEKDDGGEGEQNHNHGADAAIGYPILLKAAAGGGGKGMRICHSDEDLREAFPLAKAEAKNFFKDDRLLIEKFIENPHHIEFQVLCCPVPQDDEISENMIPGLNPFPILSDNNNKKKTQVVVFPERECSIQRRNQKIIEETPSTLLTEETRSKMIQQVTKLCQTVGYESAGTVEFLVDEKQNFYFLEMNTRLQVEHPVSEAICDVDLVKGMLWVGAGWGLPNEFIPQVTQQQQEEKEQEEQEEKDTTASSKELPPIILPWKGHAIEARIYAEDPTKGFVPSTGTLLPYIEPSSYLKSSVPVASSNDEVNNNDNNNYVRIDSGVRQGTIVSPYYDPMLSKVIAYSSKSRNDCIDVLSNALDEYVIEGVQHNSCLVNDILRDADFRRGDTPTSYIPNHYKDGIFPKDALGLLSIPEREELAVSAASIFKKIINHNNTKTTFVVKLGGMFRDEETYQVTNMNIVDDNTKVTVQRLLPTDNDGNSDETEQIVSSETVVLPPEKRIINLDTPIRYDPSKYLANVSLDGVPRSVQVLKNNNNGYANNNSSIDIGEFIVQMYGAKIRVFIFDNPREYELSKYMKPPPVKNNSKNVVPSPMPGTLISFSVQEGDKVEIGQDLCIVEAMKMQNIIKAPRSGTIQKLNVDVGTSLLSDQIIVEFATEEEEEKNAAS